MSIRTTSPPSISAAASNGSISSICCFVCALVLIYSNPRIRIGFYFNKYSAQKSAHREVEI